jgi:hypothetical protein
MPSSVAQRLEISTASPNQGYDEQNQEDDKADFSDRRSSSSNDSETENTGDKSNDEKYDSVA